MPFESCTLPGLYVLRWIGTPTIKDLDDYALETARAHEAQGKPLVGLFIMAEDSVAPDSEFRTAQANKMPQIMSHLEYAVAVFEGQGFVASIKRNALAGILLVASKRFPIHVRASVREALVDKPAGPIRFSVPNALTELRKRGFST